MSTNVRQSRRKQVDVLEQRIQALEAECAVQSELLHQRAAEVSSLRQQVDAVHRDPIQWLLSASARTPEPFVFEHAATPDLISVVIPAYKAQRFLERAVESVWEQELANGSIEILLCEDGSPDDTYEVAVALQKHSPVPMQVLTHPGRANRGVSATRNLGLRQARGSLIALLDADDRWLPGRLGVQLAYLEKQPDAQCLCSLGQYRDLDGRKVRGWGGTTIAGEYAHIPAKLDIKPPYTFDQVVRYFNIINSTLLIRREAVGAVGGYPELMAHQAEDWLLMAKLSLLGPIHLVEEKLIDYTIHRDSYTFRYTSDGFAYGSRIEFLLHLVHWMLQQPAYRERGMEVFRRDYPRLLVGYRHIGLLLEEYLQKTGMPRPAADDFEHYLVELHDELEQLRRYYHRKERLLGPLRRIPGLKPVLRSLWRVARHALGR